MSRAERGSVHCAGHVIKRHPSQLIAGVLQLILTSGNEKIEYVLDGGGRETWRGRAPKPDTTITMSMATFMSLARSSGRTKTAITQYFSGKLKVVGDLALAMEFAELADVVLNSDSRSGSESSA